MQRSCVVYPTSRCIRVAIQGFDNVFSPNFMTMGEFLARSRHACGKITPDNDLRLIGLYEASDFTSFSALDIDRNFFGFMQNSQYIFRFFEELASEDVSIESLMNADTYSEYDEHLSILEYLRRQYLSVCRKNNWADPIYYREVYTINKNFLINYDTVTIYVEGYLSRQEMEILLACTEYVDMVIKYVSTSFNRKMTERFSEIGIELDEGYQYTVSLNTASIISKIKLSSRRDIQCETFTNRLSQVGFIKAKIEEFVNNGVNPENIAVILPDEGFARYLKEFDNEGNFNFAMGSEFSSRKEYHEIENIIAYLDEPNVLNTARISEVNVLKIEWIRRHRSASFRYELLEEFFELGTQESDEWRNAIDDELQHFRHLTYILETLPFGSVLKLFMNRIGQRRQDDVRGGKITVMGLLESRGMAFEGVIVVDFNEGYVPHRSEKDLFLNTKIRKHSGLPTTGDRESLQKHYYWMMFNRAGKIAVSCVHNAESIPSRFLMQLDIRTLSQQKRYESVLFPDTTERPRKNGVSPSEYDFESIVMSASSLKSFLTCRRQFYYRYVCAIKPHDIPRDLSEERDMGNELHRVLERVYNTQASFSNADELRLRIKTEWEKDTDTDAMERHMRRFWYEKLSPFFENEIARFHEGWEVTYRELLSETMIEGIRFSGRIDRIDRLGDTLEIIDYKSGSYPDITKAPSLEEVDYQLSIYACMAEALGEVAYCSYYDLTNGVLVREPYLQERIENLQNILREIREQKTWEWERTEEYIRCRYCPYAYLCEREGMHAV